MDRYQLKEYAKKNPDLYDHDELLQHIEGEEITTELYEHRAVECINNTIDLLTESVQEKISDYLQRWFDKGDFYDYDIPEGMNSREFACLVKEGVREKL